MKRQPMKPFEKIEIILPILCLFFSTTLGHERGANLTRLHRGTTKRPQTNAPSRARFGRDLAGTFGLNKNSWFSMQPGSKATQNSTLE
jgi:hypothetical protein